MNGLLTSLELCAGAGGQAIGLESAGFDHVALVEIDHHACATLRKNRPAWNVIQGDMRKFSAVQFRGVDLVCAGVPCPPFSVASRQLGEADERNLFPDALRIVAEASPRAVLFENVPGLASPKFRDTLDAIIGRLGELGYCAEARVLNACDYGTPQLRPRLVIVGLRPGAFAHFRWPKPVARRITVGEALLPLMKENGWRGAEEWAAGAEAVAPTLVGGSKKHGGADLGPTRARQAWAKLNVDGRGLGNEAPGADFAGVPRLTVPMAARLQGFPEDWVFCGGKTAAYRQVGNAFPPQVSSAVGGQIANALRRDSVRPVKADKVPAIRIAKQEILPLG